MNGKVSTTAISDDESNWVYELSRGDHDDDDQIGQVEDSSLYEPSAKETLEQSPCLPPTTRNENEGHIRVGVRGYLFPSRYREGLQKVHNFQVREGDIYIVTFPRSGTTWTQELVWLIANDLNFEQARAVSLPRRYPVLEFFLYIRKSVKDKYVAQFGNDAAKRSLLEAITTFPEDLLAATSSPRFIKTHLPLSLLPPLLMETAKVVYVARDPRDVAISFFYVCKMFSKLNPVCDDFKEVWNLFIKDLVLFSPIFEHVKEAWAQRHHPNLLFLFYEDLAKDLPSVINRVASFLGKQLNGKQVAALTEHLRFENFKKNPAVQLQEFDDLGLLCDADLFIRKGKAGGWREYFDDEMKRQAQQWMDENLRGTDLNFSDV